MGRNFPNGKKLLVRVVARTDHGLCLSYPQSKAYISNQSYSIKSIKFYWNFCIWLQFVCIRWSNPNNSIAQSNSTINIAWFNAIKQQSKSNWINCEKNFGKFDWYDVIHSIDSFNSPGHYTNGKLESYESELKLKYGFWNFYLFLDLINTII